MTEQQNLQVTVRTMYSYLIEKGYYEDYSTWTKEKIKGYEKAHNMAKNKNSNSNT